MAALLDHRGAGVVLRTVARIRDLLVVQILARVSADFARCFSVPSMARRGVTMGMDTFMDLLRKNLSDKDFTRMMEFTAAIMPERRSALLQFIAERETLAPAVGADAPDFKLPHLDGAEEVQLSSFRGQKPVALIFDSYT
jgi:hypothetical protein